VSIAIKVDKNARSDAEAKGKKSPGAVKSFLEHLKDGGDVPEILKLRMEWRIGWGRLRSPGSKKGGDLKECVWLNVEERERG